MKQMLNYRAVLLAQTGIFSRIINKCIEDVVPTGSTHIPQPKAIDYRQVELSLSRSGSLTRKLIRNPTMPSDEP